MHLPSWIVRKLSIMEKRIKDRLLRPSNNAGRFQRTTNRRITHTHTTRAEQQLERADDNRAQQISSQQKVRGPQRHTCRRGHGLVGGGSLSPATIRTLTVLTVLVILTVLTVFINFLWKLIPGTRFFSIHGSHWYPRFSKEIIAFSARKTWYLLKMKNPLSKKSFSFRKVFPFKRVSVSKRFYVPLGESESW